MFEPLYRLYRRIVRLLGDVLWRIASPFLAIPRLLDAGLALLAFWWTSRVMRDLLLGLPALAVGTAAVVLLVSHLVADPTHVRDSYLQAAQTAYSNEDYEASKLLYERAVRAGADDNETYFNLARAAEHAEDFPRMEAIVEYLAPVDAPRYAPAHLRQAYEYLSMRPQTQETIALAEVHLRHALQLRPDDTTARAILGELYLQTGRKELALDHLALVARQRPEIYLSLAKACLEVGDGRASYYLEQAKRFHASVLEKDSGDLAARLRLAEAALLLKEYPQAMQVLKEGMERVPDDQRLRYALGRVYAEWGFSYAGNTPQEREVQWQLFSAALTANPDEFSVYNGILHILQAQDATADKAQSFLVRSIAEGRSVGLSHLLLGSMSFAGGDYDQANLHLSQAWELMPHYVPVANNLAWVLAFKEDPEVERALALIDRVIEQQQQGGILRGPFSKQLLDTRGQIRVKLGQWREALSDLERTLPEYRHRPQTHRALAECYEHLGNPQLADEHRRLANQQ